MKALRVKAVTAASALLCGIAASGASFEKGPIELPAVLPIQLSMPFAAIPADALNALDPLSKAIPAVPPAAAVPAARLPAAPAALATISAAASSKGSPTAESVESRRQRLDGQFDGAGAFPLEADIVPPSAFGAGGIVKAPLPSPAKYYVQAFAEAVYQAQRKGAAQRAVTLREVTGNIPAPAQGARLLYAFDAAGAGKSFRIYVDFAPEWAAAGRRYGARVSVYRVPAEKISFSASDSAPERVSRAVRMAPETALRLAREKSGLSSSASFALRPDVRGGLSYNFFDGDGWHVVVDGRTGQVSIVRQPAEKPSKKLDRIHAGLRRRVEAMRPRVSEEEIEAVAAEIAKYKGMPWSHSEYDGYRINAAETLRRKGATKKQLEQFEGILEKAPIIGGRFNPWSGD